MAARRSPLRKLALSGTTTAAFIVGIPTTLTGIVDFARFLAHKSEAIRSPIACTSCPPSDYAAASTN